MRKTTTRFYMNGWTKREENTLAAIMLSGKKKESIDELFEKAATELERSKSACMNRWYDIRFEYLNI